MEEKDILNRFVYHKPKEDDVMKYVTIRQQAKQFADIINGIVPEGREKSLAISKLEEVVMWANAGIARRGE